jgi:hypothetical protein
MRTATKKTAAAPAKKAAAAPQTQATEVDLGAKGKRILDKMAEFRQVRLNAEREEKLLKAQLKELLPEPKKGTKLIVRTGKVIRGTVSWRSRKNTDLDLLLQGWPEAYEQCTSDNEYTQFDPA